MKNTIKNMKITISNMKNLNNLLVRGALSLVALQMSLVADAQGINGSWHGKLDLGTASLNIVMNVETAEKVTLDSPDQGAYGIPTTVEHLSADSISVSVPALMASYAGRLADNKIRGTFAQAGYSFPLTLEPGGVKLSRPQTPQPPFGYKMEEVTFSNDGHAPGDSSVAWAEKAELAGTLTYPIDFKKGMPVVVLVSGSGQQNRDEELFGHKPFLVIADYLAKHGIASLRYDDRGVGKSAGVASKTTIMGNMTDAAAAIEYLKATKQFGQIGIVGHSEGGQIACMLAARKGADFIVSMAGPALRADSILIMQNRDLLLKAGLDAPTTDNYCLALSRILEYKAAQYAGKQQAASNGKATRPTKKRSAEADFALLTMGIQLPETLRINLLQVLKDDSEWLGSWLLYDIAADIRMISCPVMAIGGERDMQVNAQANLAAYSNLLPKAKGMSSGKSSADKNIIRQYPGLNHLFQPCQMGGVDEYSKIETTISEEVLHDIATWINQVN